MKTRDRVLKTIEEINFNSVFVVDDKNEREYTYGSFFDECMKISLFLSIQYDTDTIVAIMENSYELFKLYFVAMLSNKKIIVVDPVKGIGEIEEIIRGIGTALLVKEEKLELKNTSFCEIDKKILKHHEEKIEYNKSSVLEAVKKIDFHATYLTTFTSGTSGVTKGVKHSLENLFSTAFAFWDASKEQSTGCFFHVMPMTYMAGILNSIFLPFVMKQRIIIAGRFSVKTAITFWKKLEKYKIDTLWLSPTMLTMIEQIDRGDMGEKYCRENRICFWVGTAALTEKVRRNFENRYGVSLYASYGLSETLFISVENDLTREGAKKNNVGTLLGGIEYKIKEDGELLLCVPWMYQGYTNEENASYFEGGYYKTGDLAEMKQNVLYIVGRKKELIIKGGLNISPVRIEECINELGSIKENAVFGVRNSSGEETICCAYVQETEDETCETDVEIEMNKTVMNRLGKNYKIDRFRKVEVLPRNINGKIDKNKLREAGNVS